MRTIISRLNNAPAAKGQCPAVVPLTLVLGHTARGAIKGAIANAEFGNLTVLLATIKPAVGATTYAGERTSRNYAFVDAVARKNVEMTMADIRKDSPVLTEIGSKGAIKRDRRCDVQP